MNWRYIFDATKISWHKNQALEHAKAAGYLFMLFNEEVLYIGAPGLCSYPTGINLEDLNQ